MKDEKVDEKYNKYTANLKRVFSKLELGKSDDKVNEVVDLAKRYFKDAEYFKNNNKHVTALISLAYCEGLLDALRLTGCIDFTWTGGENEKKE